MFKSQKKKEMLERSKTQICLSRASLVSHITDSHSHSPYSPHYHTQPALSSPDTQHQPQHHSSSSYSVDSSHVLPIHDAANARTKSANARPSLYTAGAADDGDVTVVDFGGRERVRVGHFGGGRSRGGKNRGRGLGGGSGRLGGTVGC